MQYRIVCRKGRNPWKILNEKGKQVAAVPSLEKAKAAVERRMQGGSK